MRLATLYGLASYVDEKLVQMDREPAAQIASILLHVLLPCRFSPRVERPEMVSTLLHHGTDPNFRRGMGSHQTTTWLNVLGHISKYGDSQITRLLVMAGADLDALRGVAHCSVIAEYLVKDSVVLKLVKKRVKFSWK